jgi:Tfp pilus assembly protein PilF
MLSFVESDAYGNRYFIAASALFTIGLANLLHKCFRSKVIGCIALGFIAACVISQYFMIAQYKIVLAYNHPFFSIEALSQSFQVFFNNPLLLLRSTNFFRLMGFEHAEWDFVDGMYLLIFPLAQLTCVVGVLYLFGSSTQSLFILKKIIQPKHVVIAGVLTSLVLVGGVRVGAPNKSVQEIEKRVNYKKLLSAGNSFLTNGNINSALVSFDKASEIMPDLWTPYFKQGVIFGSQKKFKQAVQKYKKGHEIYPDHPSILANYGATLAILGETNQSESLLRAAIRQMPNNSNAYNSLAQVYLKKNNPSKSRDMLLLAVAVNPGFGTGHANLAMLYVMMNQRDNAKIHLDKALGLGLRNSMTENLQTMLQNVLPLP